MLRIDKNVLNKIKKVFISKDYEQGFLLGSSSCLEQLEHCFYVPTVCASREFYIPDVRIANEGICQWGMLDICFCGFIHSHVNEKYELSMNDIEFAKQMFSAYNLPMMWFGIGVCCASDVELLFYCVKKNQNTDIEIISMTYQEI